MAARCSDRTGAGVVVETRRSRIHGRGVFAGRRFRRGAYIASFEGTPVDRDGSHVLWVEAEDGEARAIRVTNDLRFLNHTRQPNAEIEGLDLYAVRNIQPGTEIVIHYGPDWEDVD